MSPAPAVSAAKIHPYPGLRSFTSEEPHLFFGREGQSDEILRRLERFGFAAVVGTSGCGKSSLVRAGLLPALLAGYAVDAGSSWVVADLHPGGDPLGHLAHALGRSVATGATDGTDSITAATLRSASAAVVQAVARARREGRLAADTNVLLFVDQFEELFRYTARAESATADRDEKARFVGLLLEAVRVRAERIFVVLTLRAEFLGDCAQFRDLPEAINRGQYLVPRLTRLQRRAAIEGPARVAGAEVAPHLVQRLLNDLGEDPDQLPVLQNALLRIWGAWVQSGAPEREIEFEQYAAVGTTPEGATTLKAALDRHVDEALADVKERLGPGAESLVKGIFLRLRGRDDRGRETRTPATVRELCAVTGADLAAVRTAVDCFRDDVAGRTFLTPFKSQVETVDPDDEIDITHESLLRCWTALQDRWVPEEEDSKRIYTALARRAEEDPSRQNLLRGSLFERASEWWKKRQPNAAWAARYHPGFAAAEAYLAASRRSDERSRLLGRSAFGLAALLLAGVLFTFYYFHTVRDARQRAVVNLMAARAALAVSEEGAGPATGLLLAAESLRRLPTPEAQAVALQALALLPPPLAVPSAFKARQVAFGADGARLAALDTGGAVRVWATRPGPGTATVLLQGVRFFAFARRGASLAGVREDGTLAVVDVRTGREVGRFDCPSLNGPSLLADGATPAALSGDGLVLAALCGGEVRVWKASSTEAPVWKAALPWLVPLQSDLGSWNRLALDDRGETLALGAAPGGDFSSFLKLLSLAEDRQIEAPDLAEGVAALSFLPSAGGGIALALGGESGKVQVWSRDAAKQKWETRTIFKHSSAVTSLSVDTLTATLIAGYRDGVARVWDLGQDRELARLIGKGPFPAVALSLSDHQAWAVDQAETLHAWDLGKFEDAIPLARAAVARFYTDLPLLCLMRTTSDGSRYEILDLRKKAPLGDWDPKGNRYPVGVSPDGAAAAVRVRTGAGIAGLNLSGFSAGRIGEPRWPRTVAIGGSLRLPLFSPNGRHLAGFVTDSPGENRDPLGRLGLFVWSTLDGKEELYRPEAPGYAARPPFQFTPDSQRILIVSHDRQIKALSLAAGGKDEKPLAIAPEGRVTALAFSPDGGLLATATYFDAPDDPEEGQSRAAIQIRSFPGGRELASFGQETAVRDLAFSPDSRYLLSSGDDDSATVWNLEKKQREVKLPAGGRALAIAFTRNGEAAVLDGSRLTFHVWKPAALVAEACRRVRRNLTPEQWQQNVPGEDFSKTCPALP